MQIERLLHTQGFGTRKECRALVRAGYVRIAGDEVDDPFADIPTAGLVLEVDGELWAYHERAYLMLHKPQGFECSQRPQFHPSVFSLLPDPVVRRGVQSVGRLDEDTTGLLLFSDDGQFIHVWSSGKKRIPKVYEVTTKHPVDVALMDRLLAGVELHDEIVPVAAAACEQTGKHGLRLTVTEGKYHQVKRMVAAAGNRVEGLHRSQVGGLTLTADLPAGEWRWLEATDLALLADFPAAG
jgi:16S rRNA pseudouridine516 synthase